LANCEGNPEAVGSSEIVSAYLVPATGEPLSLCLAEALFFGSSLSSRLRATKLMEQFYI